MGNMAIDYNKDFYGMLGVSPDASSDEIMVAFRQAARKYHPDVNKTPDAVIKFREAVEAKDVLTDERLRGQYDNYRRSVVTSFDRKRAAAAYRQYGSGLDDWADNESGVIWG